MAATALSTILKRTTLDDHEEVLKACNTALKQSKGDLDALHVKAVALLKLDRYEDALRVLEEGGDKLKERGLLERAYALYKVGDLEAAKIFAKSVGGSRGARHVEAQATYRLEEFVQTAELYKQLSTSQAAFENEENDLRINSGATDAQLEWTKQGHLVQKKKPGREDLEAFETAYNAACGSIARGELGQGEVLLKRAKDLCSSLEELSEQEKNAELLPIGVQQLYVLCRLGKVNEAEKLASEIAIQDIPDLSTQQIAKNNKLTSSTQPSNPYLSHRFFHSSPTLLKSDKFFAFQTDIMRRNSLTLDLLESKFTGVANSTSKALSDEHLPATTARINGLSVLNAAAHAQNQLGKHGLKEILPLLEKRPTDLGLIMTIVQLYILTNNHGTAITVMESLLKRLDDSNEPNDQDVRFAPGLVAVVVSLYTVQGRKSHIRSELARAASYWRRKPKPQTRLLRAAGLALLESPNEEDLKTAAEIFDTLRKQDTNDGFAIAGYIASHATYSPSQVEPEVERLTPVSRLTADIDVAALEAAGIPQIVTAATTTASRKRGLDGKDKPAIKRVRKSKLPKDLDPSKPPDPERWLPLRDRSNYRPKGKKGKQKGAAMTQGGVSDKGSESLNMAASDGVIKPASSGVVSSSKTKNKKKAKK
ncbi:MAG: signal recognition particle [Lasallia pustulata]|uniref:Signal recognition particle subunit SRP72 n=1 Tax=Lasallia pustulata TaxID=136370 RepID=A0A5M8PZA3_9LECA|nr:MAG: signal recognition particle [Lasallia pustulata]